jgi:glutamine amidotransferase
MCRWLAYSGAPVFLEDLLFQPEHSLIDQSLAARRTSSTTNGDGFGVGWYDHREAPGVYKDIQPAWNDPNLRALASQIRSPLFLAHVRSSTGTAVQRSNCHPFRFGRWLFVHNGLVEGFRELRRALLFEVNPELFPEIDGTTDSELLFFLALSYGLEDDPFGALERAVGFVEGVAQSHGVPTAVQMTVGLADGKRLYAVRYSSEGDTRTLFHSKSVDAIREINPDLAQRLPAEARAIVSEPIGDLDIYWEEIPESTAVLLEAGEVDHRPFTPQVPAGSP